MINIKPKWKTEPDKPNSSEIKSRVLEAIKEHLTNPRNDFIRSKTIANKVEVADSQRVGFILSDLQEKGYLQFYQEKERNMNIYKPRNLDSIRELQIADI